MKTLKAILGFLLQLGIMVLLPFFILIRGSVFFYQQWNWHFIPSLLLAMGILFVILLIYVAMVWDAIFGANKISRKSLKGKVGFVSVMILLFTGYTVFNLSSGHAKSEEVRKEYRSLHPFLRISVGTIVLVDESLLITDLSRQKEDYRKMGLKSKRNSLHYKQKTGFVHAMDLRTKGRSSLQNALMQNYFRLMGFRTLRHVGTADHLHVSLSIPDNPAAI